MLFPINNFQLSNSLPLQLLYHFMKKFEVPNIYRSSLLSAIKNKRKEDDKMKKDFTPTLLDLGFVKFHLARHFGFCYGVENAIEISFKTIEENPGKRIFLLSEMIHNPQVNATLKEKGVQFLQDTYGKQLISFEEITKEDVVLIPAFGTTLELENMLKAKGITTEKYNTTCPFVEKVWNRSEQIASKGYSIVVHGKPKHEETRATFSHASSHIATVIVNDMKDAVALGKFITGEKPSELFYDEFKGLYSDGFDIEKDLQRFGVVNQTTQLASDTQAIAEYLKKLVMQHYGLTEITVAERFADTRDTLCYATNDNQSAVTGMLETPADIAFIVGGYNSSNTTHLVELCEEKLPTYFINSDNNIISSTEIRHFNFHDKKEYVTKDFFPAKRPLNILISSGASCPDSLVEDVMKRICTALSVTFNKEELIKTFQ